VKFKGFRFKNRSDRALVQMALRNNAAKWEEWVLTLASPDTAEIFRRQAEDARRIADEIEDA
jgi:hypothetical protein